jgi:glycosyltransferase involved in cell wall biosynthesis
MSPKILIVGQLPPPYHGSNVMTKIFYSSLSRLGYTVSIAEKTFSKKMDEVGKYSVKKIFRAQAALLRIVRNFVTARADLCFYFISLKPPSFYVDVFFLFLLHLIGTRTVLYVHAKGFRKFSKQSPLMRRLLRSPLFSESTGALILGKRVKKDIDFFISGDRIFVLPNCVPDLRSQALKPFPKIKKNDEVRILYLSNLVPSKGSIEFIKMARLVDDSGKRVKFILAGGALSDSYFRTIVQLISELKLTDNIEMPGPVYGPEKEKLFQDSDIFVFPTYFELETFPLVNLEAMSAGLPIVSSNEGCIPEVVLDGINGYIVDPNDVNQLADRVLKLVNNDDLRIEMGKAGRKFYEERFTVEVYEQQLRQAVKFFSN